jgi:hypothetical protein
MTGREENTSRSFANADDMAGSWSAQNTIVSDNELLDTIGSSNLGNQLSHLWIPVSAVTANDQSASLDAFRNGEQDTGNECLAVVWLLKHLDLLAKSGAALVSVYSFPVEVGPKQSSWAAISTCYTYVPGFWSVKGVNSTVLASMMSV